MDSKINSGQIIGDPSPLNVVVGLLEPDAAVKFNLAIACEEDKKGNKYGGLTDDIEFQLVSVTVNFTNIFVITATCLDSRFVRHTSKKSIFELVYNAKTKIGFMRRVN